MTSYLRRMFSSLGVRNYRLFFVAQVFSNSGTWMQQVAVAWLILGLTSSSIDLGIATGLQMAPYLLFGMWGGLLVDRLDKRRLLIWTQTLQTIPALALWILTATGAVEVWMVFLIVFARGCLNTLDNPARQSFVIEMVGRDRLANAVALNASQVQASRLVGPAVAALVIASLGLDDCFLINTATFGLTIGALLLMDTSKLFPGPVAKRGGKQIRAGFAFAARTPNIRLPLLMMALVGLFAYNFTVVLPLVARFTFHGTASTYALMTSTMAVGALAGSLTSGLRAAVTPRMAAIAAVIFGVSMGLAAAAPTLTFSLVALLAVGASSVLFTSSVQSTLQLGVDPEMRGRVMSLYQLFYQGSTPIGAVLVGTLCAVAGARAGFAIGSIAALIAGICGVAAGRSPRPESHAGERILD